MSKRGMAGVPKYSEGSPIGAPEPRSASNESSIGPSYGAKKSVARKVPSGCRPTRTTASPSVAGGLVPARGPDTAPPLPVANKICPAASDTSPPPAPQMPAPAGLPAPDSVVHIVVTRPVVDTPTIQPYQ